MRWLLSPSDRYFSVMKQIAEIDKDVLPDADIIIFFEVDKENWLNFLRNRNRSTDNDKEFLKTLKPKNFSWKPPKNYARKKA